MKHLNRPLSRRSMLQIAAAITAFPSWRKDDILDLYEEVRIAPKPSFPSLAQSFVYSPWKEKLTKELWIEGRGLKPFHYQCALVGDRSSCPKQRDAYRAGEFLNPDFVAWSPDTPKATWEGTEAHSDDVTFHSVVEEERNVIGAVIIEVGTHQPIAFSGFNPFRSYGSDVTIQWDQGLLRVDMT